MIKISRDPKRNTLIIEFSGKVDRVQAEKSFLELEKILPKVGKGFSLLTDFTSVETVDIEIKSVIEKSMDLINARGVAEVLRVVPDPEMDIGFNIMSAFHYSKEVPVLTLRSREEAQGKLGTGE